MHIVAQVNHRRLGLKVETNCLRDSDLIPRHSFLSTTFSIFINGVLKFMCVFACSLVADKANLSSELSKCKQSKSILKVMTLVMPWLILLKPSFLVILHACIGIHVNERYAWPYPPCINCLKTYKMPYP